MQSNLAKALETRRGYGAWLTKKSTFLVPSVQTIVQHSTHKNLHKNSVQLHFNRMQAQVDLIWQIHQQS